MGRKFFEGACYVYYNLLFRGLIFDTKLTPKITPLNNRKITLNYCIIMEQYFVMSWGKEGFIYKIVQHIICTTF